MNNKMHCRTNLDEFKRDTWPDTFIIPPQIGHRVCSAEGTNLKIVGITHMGTNKYNKEPYIIVELHH
jgi:hypothetical protein